MTGRRWSVRTRLSVLVGALFLLSGLLLLAANYLLFRANLPTPLSFVDGRTGSIVINGPSTGETSTVTVLRPLQDYRDAALNTMLVQSAVVLALAAALAVLLGRVVAGQVLRPVRQVTATARRLGVDDLERERIAMGGARDELTELADTFDAMLDRLAAAFDSQRRFVANASHELRTPLAVQRTLIEVALAAPDVDPATTALGERLLAMNERSEQLVESLLVLARSDRRLPDRQPVRLDEVAARVVAGTTAEAAEAGVTVHTELSPATVSGDPVLLERLVVNLLQNAVRHNHPGGEVWLRVAGAPPVLDVANTGAEVPADAVATLFEPFHRLGGRRVGSDRGAGLGLSIVAAVVTAHDGSVEAAPRTGGGLAVLVHLPEVDRSDTR